MSDRFYTKCIVDDLIRSKSMYKLYTNSHCAIEDLIYRRFTFMDNSTECNKCCYDVRGTGMCMLEARLVGVK